MDTQALIQYQFEQRKQLGTLICLEMLLAIKKLGFSAAEINNVPVFDQAEFSLTKDPYTAAENLTGYWFDNNKQRIGEIQFNSDGSFYAEYDIVKPHPAKTQWFVVAMSAWGSEQAIKTEAKLLASLE